MSAVGTLALLQARRDRWELAVWIGGIAGLGFAAATAISTQFGADNERAALITVAAASPAFLFLRGLPDGISTGAVTFFSGLFLYGGPRGADEHVPGHPPHPR
ncbi:hypothetical protein AAHB34_00875 [Paenarthrobacter ureafaciens]